MPDNAGLVNMVLRELSIWCILKIGFMINCETYDQ